MSPRPPGDLPGFPPELEERYAPLALLGQGGMGAVFRAQDRELGREVAIKLLRGVPTGKLRDRFLREARVLASVRHPNVVEVYDHGAAGGDPFMVMELLRGESLDRWEPHPDPLPVLLPVADALEELHARGLVHRDVKPANLFRNEDGRTVLTDFGLVRDPDRTRLTRTGAVSGTLAFMAPELLQGSPSTPATDWWAFGATLLWMKEHRLPFSVEAMVAMANGAPRPPLARAVQEGSGPLARVIRGCLEVDPERRPSSRAELEALAGRSDEAEEPPPSVPSSPSSHEGSSPLGRPRARPGLPTLLVVGVAGLALGLLTLALHPAPPRAAPRVSSDHTPRPAPAHPTEAFVIQLEEELPRLADLGLDPAGEVRALPPGGLPEGWTELLDPDPLRWPQVFERLVGAQDFHLWLEEGGRTEEIPRRVRGRMDAIDRRLAALQLPEVFHPFLHTRPSPEPVALPEDLALAFVEAGVVARSQGGWTGALVQAIEEARRAEAGLERELMDLGRGRPPTPHLPVELVPTVAFTMTSPEVLVEQGFFRATSRPGMRRWMAEGVRAYRRALYAAGRSLGPDQPGRASAALLADALLGAAKVFSFSEVGVLPVEVLTGPLPVDPDARYLEAVVLGRQIDVVEAALADTAALQQAELRALAAACRAPWTTRAQAYRGVNALGAAMDRLRRRGDLAGSLELYRRHSPKARADPAWALSHRMRLGAAVAWLRAPAALGPTPEELDEVRRYFAEFPGRFPDESKAAVSLGELRDLVYPEG